VNIEYSIELTDIEAFTRFTFDRIPLIRKRVSKARFICTSFGVFFLLFGLLLLNSGKTISILFFSASAVFFVYILIAKLLAKKTHAKRVRTVYNSNDYTGKHTFTITPEFIKDIRTTGHSTTSWAGIFMVGVTDQHLFIILKQGLSAVLTPRLCGFIVPKRAFPDDASFNQFIETANKYFEASKIIQPS
jgi:hypothetical protein